MKFYNLRDKILGTGFVSLIFSLYLQFEQQHSEYQVATIKVARIIVLELLQRTRCGPTFDVVTA